MGSKRKRGEGGGDHPMSPMKNRLRRRAFIAGTEDPLKGRKKGHQPELNDDFDFTNQDLAEPDMANDVGEKKYVPHPAPQEDKFKHENEGVNGMDSNRINDVDEAETPSIDSIGENVHVADSTSELSHSDTTRVGQMECGNNNGSGATSKSNSNTCTNANGNVLPTDDEMTVEQHEGTIRSENEHIGGDTISSQHLEGLGGTTAAERAQKILAILESSKKDVSKILTAGYLEDEKNAENQLSTIQAKDGEIARLTKELQTATGQAEFLQRKVDFKSFRIQELSSRIKLLEDKLQNRTAECKGLREELDEEKKTFQRELHTKNVDLERQTKQTTLLEEEQRELVRKNSRIVEELQEELKEATRLYNNTVSLATKKDKKLKSQAGEIRGYKEDIEQLNSDYDRLNKSLIPKLDGEIKRLKKDNADLSRLVTEKDQIIQQRIVETEGLQKNLKNLEDYSIARRAESVKARKLADEKLRKQQEETKMEIDLLKNAILEKDNELAPFKVKYLRDEKGNSQLHLAAKSGNEQAVKDLLALEADVNAGNYNAETPIILAASSGVDADVALKIIKLLIERGADEFSTNGQGQTFLHKFTSNENPPTSAQFLDILDFLVSKDLTRLFNVPDTDNGTTPFMLAARNVDLDMATISLLQTNGVDFHRVDNHGRSYLSYAAEGNKNVNLLLQLNRNGVGIRHMNVAQAIEAGDEDSLILLVWRGADVNPTNVSQTPLQLAAKSRNTPFSIRTIKLLINSGANVDSKDKHGYIFLHQFVDVMYPTIHPEDFHELVSFLISKDLSRLFNAPNNAGITPFHLAVHHLEIETATLSLLKDSGVDFNAVNNLGFSVLCYAIRSDRRLTVISDLVAFGANPKHLTSSKESMLHLAACTGRLGLQNFLLDQGLDVNARNWCGQTALHCAIQRRENVIETVQFLVGCGANPDIVDDKGKSPRDYFNEKRESYPDAKQISICFSLGSSR